MLWLIILLVALPAMGAETNTPLGYWLNTKGTVAIKIIPCPEDSGLCGRIAWLKKPYRKNGELKLDNGQPYCNLTVVRGMRPEGDTTWSRGTIYDPDSGFTYRGSLALEDSSSLRVKGYLGIPLFRRTLRWQRIDTPPGDCPTAGNRTATR